MGTPLVCSLVRLLVCMVDGVLGRGPGIAKSSSESDVFSSFRSNLLLLRLGRGSGVEEDGDGVKGTEGTEVPEGTEGTEGTEGPAAGTVRRYVTRVLVFLVRTGVGKETALGSNRHS